MGKWHWSNLRNHHLIISLRHILEYSRSKDSRNSNNNPWLAFKLANSICLFLSCTNQIGTTNHFSRRYCEVLLQVVLIKWSRFGVYINANFVKWFNGVQHDFTQRWKCRHKQDIWYTVVFNTFQRSAKLITTTLPVKHILKNNGRQTFINRYSTIWFIHTCLHFFLY